MKIDVSTRSATSYGGNSTYSLAGQFLEDGLGAFGPAVAGVEVTACFRGGLVQNPSLQSMHDQYHTVFLPSLPTVRFLRKKARLDLTYETAVADATFLERYGFLSADVFRRVLAEVAVKLRLIDDRMKKADAFDVAAFHRAVAARVAAAPSTDDELRAVKERLDRQDRERRAAMDPWERLGVEWDEYHPAARRLLDDPFFWDWVDDHAPHGNDTGADLLADFRRWNQRNPDRPAHEMAVGLLRRWGFAPVDPDVVDEPTVRHLIEHEPDALSVADDALIAVAFAAVKLRGCCDRQTRELALKAIERERLSAVVAGRGWTHAAQRIATLKQMADALKRMPEVEQ